MCIAAWNNRITCSAGHARKKNGTSRGISRISTPPVLLSKINSLHRTLTHLTSNDAKPIQEGRASPPAASRLYPPPGGRGSIQIWKKGERKGGRNEMEISHKAWLTSTCGGASAFGAAITIFVAAVGVASMRAGGGGVARPFHSHNCTSRPKESQGKRG